MKSPFKFLDPYEPQDKEAFFGRETETRELYKLVTKNRLTFVYGPSGAGKTSLVQCGLANRFGSVDWLPFFIRRGEDINDSLRQTLASTLGKEASMENGLQKSVEQLFRQYLRPVYLIFDQFEELFIQEGDHNLEERQLFYDHIADLLDADLPCRILFIIREDYFGHLNAFEKTIPELYHRKLRVEPMSRENLRSVIVGSCSTFQIGFDDPALAPDRILDNMYAGKSSVHMPYVQVYLHMLYQEALKQQDEARKLRFSGPVIKAVGPITDVLGLFLKEQEVAISTTLNQQFPEAPEDVVRQVLDVFVGDEGTKSSVLYTLDEEGQMSLRGKVAQRLARLSPDLLSSCIFELEKSRILRRLDEHFELAHDSLAALIDQQRSAEQRQLLEISRRIEIGYQEHIDSGGIYFFTAGQLARIEPFLDKVALEPAAMEFLDKSRVEARRREEAEIKKAREKLRRQRMFSLAIGIVALVALAGGALAWRNAQMAETARHSANISALAAKAWEVYRDDHTLALRLAHCALSLDPANTDAQQTLNSILDIPTTTLYKTVFSGHVNDYDVTALDFSPDNQWIVSGSLDHVVRIWNREDGTEIGHLAPEKGGHNSKVSDVRFHPDGQSVLSSGEDGRLIRFKTDGKVLHEFEAHSYAIKGMDLSNDGSFLATASEDSTAVIWTTEGQRLATLTGHQDEVLAVDISADGRFILTGSVDGTARLWDKQGQLLQVFSLGAVKVNAVSFSPDGEKVLFGCSDHTTRLYAVDGQSIVAIGGHLAEVIKVKFTPDGKFLITASEDHTARLWTPAGEEVLKLVGHPERLSSLTVSSDGHWIATGSLDFTAKVWNLPFNLENKISRHAGPVNKVAISPDGKTIISGSADNTAKLWDVGGNLLHNLVGHQNWLVSVGVSPDGRRFLTASSDGAIKIWNKDGSLLKAFEPFTMSLSSAAFSPDGNLIIVGGNKNIWLWKPNGELVKKWEGHPASIKSVTFSPDGESLLSTDTEGLAIIWNLNGEALDSILHPDVRFQHAAFTPDGNHIISVGRELPIRIWDKNGQLIRSIYGHLDENYHIAFHPQGAIFATSSWDKTVRIWTFEGAQLQILPHPDGIYGAAFLKGGTQIVTACRDKLVRIWEVESGNLLGVLGGQTERSFEDENIASFVSIPFNPDRYEIDPIVIIPFFEDKSEKMINMGNHYLSQAEGLHLAILEKGIADLNTTELFFQNAREVANPEEKINFDSLMASLYLAKANHFLYHRKLPEFLEATQKGLDFRELPMLTIFESLGLLMNKPSAAVMEKTVALAQDTTTVCPSCLELGYSNISETISGEIWYYTEQLGVNSPGLLEFVERLEGLGLY